ncbi:hypothetical protein YPPY13_1968, partial [Yersinia pestis PY-13]
MASNF